MTQFNAPTYDIERPSGQCAFTGRSLEPGDAYIATLVELDDEARKLLEQSQSNQARTSAALGLKRLDVSVQAWDEEQRPDNLFSYWRTHVPQPNQKKRLFVDDHVLMNLLQRLADTDDAQRLAFRFVLALILMRKRLLRYDRTEHRPGGDDAGNRREEEWWIVTPKLDLLKGPLGKWSDDDTLAVLNPHLDDDQVQQVTEQLSEVLEAEL